MMMVMMMMMIMMMMVMTVLCMQVSHRTFPKCNKVVTIVSQCCSNGVTMTLQ
jgi:hypothetical protein